MDEDLKYWIALNDIKDKATARSLGLIIDDDGKETKVFHVQDGFGIVLLQRAGLKTAILSARATDAVKARAKDLKMTKVCQDAHPKLKVYQKLLKDLKGLMIYCGIPHMVSLLYCSKLLLHSL